MKLIIASNNAHKLTEIKDILGGQFDEIVGLREAGIDHETIEDGNTFMENSLKKAREIAEISGCWALADDSGLCVDALDGAPGIFSARYAGEHGNDKANNALLLKNLEGSDNRRAHFTSAIAMVSPYGQEVLCEGHVYGFISDHEQGTNGFGYDPLFHPDGYDCSMAELTAEEKNSISHRHNALVGLLEKLSK